MSEAEGDSRGGIDVGNLLSTLFAILIVALLAYCAVQPALRERRFEAAHGAAVENESVFRKLCEQHGITYVDSAGLVLPRFPDSTWMPVSEIGARMQLYDEVAEAWRVWWEDLRDRPLAEDPSEEDPRYGEIDAIVFPARVDRILLLAQHETDPQVWEDRLRVNRLWADNHARAGWKVLEVCGGDRGSSRGAFLARSCSLLGRSPGYGHLFRDIPLRGDDPEWPRGFEGEHAERLYHRTVELALRLDTLGGWGLRESLSAEFPSHEAPDITDAWVWALRRRDLGMNDGPGTRREDLALQGVSDYLQRLADLRVSFLVEEQKIPDQDASSVLLLGQHILARNLRPGPEFEKIIEAVEAIQGAHSGRMSAARGIDSSYALILVPQSGPTDPAPIVRKWLYLLPTRLLSSGRYRTELPPVVNREPAYVAQELQLPFLRILLRQGFDEAGEALEIRESFSPEERTAPGCMERLTVPLGGPRGFVDGVLAYLDHLAPVHEDEEMLSHLSLPELLAVLTSAAEENDWSEGVEEMLLEFGIAVIEVEASQDQ